MTTVTIIYKSGAKVEIECEVFKARMSELGELMSVTWGSAKPRPLYIGVSEIAAIFEGKA